MVNMLSEKLRELREAKGLVQRQVAAELEVDTAYISKMESNEKPVSRHHLKKLAVLLGIAEEELLTLWLADKLYGVVKDEAAGLKSIEVVHDLMKKNSNDENKNHTK
jgi:transcriptional regulator with XRE-family HTH domain